MSKRVKQQSTKASGSEPSVDLQRSNNGTAPEGGRFAKGNTRGFKKGQSGNPAGRPKSALLSDALRRRLAEVDDKDVEGRTHAEVIADQLIAKAKEGDVAAIREIADRVEGKARQHVTLTYDAREKLERAVAGIMRESNCTREEAIKALGEFRADALTLLNTN